MIADDSLLEEDVEFFKLLDEAVASMADDGTVSAAAAAAAAAAGAGAGGADGAGGAGGLIPEGDCG